MTNHLLQVAKRRAAAWMQLAAALMPARQWMSAQLPAPDAEDEPQQMTAHLLVTCSAGAASFCASSSFSSAAELDRSAARMLATRLGHHAAQHQFLSAGEGGRAASIADAANRRQLPC